MYILRCADGSLYTGVTNDVSARVQKHSTGRGARYTRSRLPVELVFVQRVKDKSSALKRELAIKALLRTEKVALIARYEQAQSKRAAKAKDGTTDSGAAKTPRSRLRSPVRSRSAAKTSKHHR